MLVKPQFINFSGSKYRSLDLRFRTRIWWWNPTIHNVSFFSHVDREEFIHSIVNDQAILLIDHSQDVIKLTEFEELYYSQFKDIFEENHISTDRIIILEPSPAQQFYMTLGTPNYVSIIDKKSLSKKFTHIMFNSLFINYWGRWENEELTFNKNPTHHYLSLSRHDKFNRRFINYQLHKNDLFHKGLVSHVRIPYDSEDSHPYQVKMLQTRKDFNLSAYLDFGYRKHILDSDTPVSNPKISDYLKIADKVCFELVLDSQIEEYLMPTEKVFKPLLGKTPFLYIGSPYTLKYLKTLGFETFDQIFDESYDTELIYYDRVDIIIENMKRLCDLSLTDCAKHISLADEICEYNHKYFVSMDRSFNIKNKISKKIDELLSA